MVVTPPPGGPIPVAVRISEHVVLRGHEWEANGPVVVFLHDVGDDLDAWGSTPRSIAGNGFRTVAFDLPGHGLSDGEFEAADLLAQLEAMARELTSWFGPIAMVGAGTVAELMLALGEPDAVPVQVLVTPSSFGGPERDGIEGAPAMRLILSGTLAEDAHAYVESIYPTLRGQRMLVTGASSEIGPDLLADQPSLSEHLVMFLRKYLISAHLSWIAEHADQINEAADRLRSAAEE